MDKGQYTPNIYRIDGDSAYIAITDRSRTTIMEAIVDRDDLARVIAYGRWCRRLPQGEPYIFCNTGKIFLHRFIVEATPKLVVDHINHNTLDCRKANLRICTRAQNAQNRRGPTVRSQSGVRNVSWRSAASAWVVHMRVNKETHSFGCYASLEEAAKVAKEMREKYMPFAV